MTEPKRGPGRPAYPPGEARKHRLEVLFADDELAHLDALAERWGCTRSEAVRRAVSDRAARTR